MDPTETMRRAMLDAGMEPPASISLDGKLHRFPTSKRRNDDAGWYVAFETGGKFGDFRAGIKHSWTAQGLSFVDQMRNYEQMRVAQAEYERARAAMQALAADSVSRIWETLEPAPDNHPYLTAHGTKAHGARLTTDGAIVVPLFDAEMNLASLQYITTEKKRFHHNGKADGSFWVIGERPDATTCYIAEGYATAAAIHEETGSPCYVAFSASNIPNVAKMLGEVTPAGCELVVVADNDEHGVGVKYANQTGLRYVVPPGEGDDACDYRLKGGDLKLLLQPATVDSGWLVKATDLLANAKPIKWLVKGWVARDSLMMVYGQPRAGKSFWVLDLALHLSSGSQSWNGCKMRGGTVVYLAGEGHAGISARLKAWSVVNGCSNFDMYVSTSGVGLDTPAGLSKVLTELSSLPEPPVMVIVDTLHRHLAGDENSSQDAGKLIQACDMVRSKFQATVCLVHHTPKAGSGPRGSGAWTGSVDTEIFLERGDDAVTVHHNKAKDGREQEDLFFELVGDVDLGWSDEDGDRVTGCVVRPVEAPSKSGPQISQKSHWALFERAWFDSGAEDLQGCPYVTRSALRYTLEVDGMTPTQCKAATRSDKKTTVIGSLVADGVVAPSADGWIVTDRALAAVMWMRRQ